MRRIMLLIATAFAVFATMAAPVAATAAPAKPAMPYSYSYYTDTTHSNPLRDRYGNQCSSGNVSMYGVWVRDNPTGKVTLDAGYMMNNSGRTITIWANDLVFDYATDERYNGGSYGSSGTWYQVADGVAWHFPTATVGYYKDYWNLQVVASDRTSCGVTQESHYPTSWMPA